MQATFVGKILLRELELSPSPADCLSEQGFDGLHGDPASPLADNRSTDDNYTDDRLHHVDGDIATFPHTEFLP